MARYDENEGLDSYLGRFFGGEETPAPGGSSGFDERQPYKLPGMIDAGTTVNTPELLAEQNRLYGGASGGQSVESWLQQYQTGNQATEGLDRTLQGLRGAGYDAAPYMYGSTPSGNELLINGQKRKLIAGEGSNASWYPWGTDDSAPDTGGGGGGYAAGYDGGGTGFADPAYSQLNDLANRRIGQLQQPTSFPALDQYMKMLFDQQAQAKARAQTFADQLTGRVSELQQPLLSGADSARIRAQYQNQTQAGRDNALAANRERFSARGFAPTSGLLEGTNRATNTAYDARTGTIDATLANQAIQADEQRRNMATRLQQLAYQALSGGDLGALTAAQQAAESENARFGLDQSREREMLSTAGIPVELTNTGLQNALATLGSGGNPGSALSSMFGALGLAQQQQSIDQQGTAGLFGGIGTLLPLVLKALERR